MKTDTYLEVRFPCSWFSFDLIIFTVDWPVVEIQKYRGWERRKPTQILSSSGGQIWNLLLSCQRPVNLHIVIVADILCFQLEQHKKLPPFLCLNPLQDKIIQFQVWFKLTHPIYVNTNIEPTQPSVSVTLLLVLQPLPLGTQSTKASTTLIVS